MKLARSRPDMPFGQNKVPLKYGVVNLTVKTRIPPKRFTFDLC